MGILSALTHVGSASPDHDNLLIGEENPVQIITAAQGIYRLALFEPWPLHSVRDMVSFCQFYTRRAADILSQVCAWLHCRCCVRCSIFE